MGPLLAEGYPRFPAALDALAELGGLTVNPLRFIGPNFPNSEVIFDPLLGGSGQTELAGKVVEVVTEKVFPLGEWRNDMLLLIGETGAVFAVGPYGMWRVANGLEEALNRIVCSDTELEVLRHPSQF